MAASQLPVVLVVSYYCIAMTDVVCVRAVNAFVSGEGSVNAFVSGEGSAKRRAQPHLTS